MFFGKNGLCDIVTYGCEKQAVYF